MSELFNLSHVFSESSIVSDIVKQYSRTTFLSEAVSVVREHGDTEFSALNDLYSTILEAESKAAENAKFADYFKEYKRIVEQYIFKARELASKFSINIETFADANKDILDVPENPNILATSTYTGVEYDNLLNSEVPNIDPYKVFKKEFAFIGKLLQDLGPETNEETKARVIATVCNNLSKDINDGWLDKIIEKIADCDDCDKDGFAKTMYNKFVKEPSKEMQIDVGLIKQSKLAIMNYTSYIDVIEKSTDAFCDGIQKVADEVGSMFYRNKDHKLPVKTDVDGVEDRTYHLGDYSFNQVNMFISTKISQMNEICNLYLIALSIKMDCIVKYLHQCKDIINTAAAGVDSTPNNQIDPGDNDTDDDGLADNGDENVNDADDDDIGEDNDDNIESDPAPSDDDDTVVQDNSESEIEQECYLFEANLLQKERYTQYYALMEAYIMEEGEENNQQATAKKKSLRAIVDNIIAQVKKMVQQFVNKFTTEHGPEIKYIENNRDRILKAVIPAEWTIQNIDVAPLLQLQIADFNEADAGILGDKTKYIQEKYKNIIGQVEGDKASAKDLIMAKVYDSEEKPYDDSKRKEGLDYITKTYKVALDNIKKAETKLDSAAKKANVIINKAQQESAIFDEEATMAMYFMEDTKEISQEDQDKNKEKNPESAKEASKNEALKNYFMINSDIIVAVMNILEQAFKKHFDFLSALAKLNGAQPFVKKNDENENKEQPTNAD